MIKVNIEISQRLLLSLILYLFYNTDLLEISKDLALIVSVNSYINNISIIIINAFIKNIIKVLY